jgi:adenylosuccinate synthase
MMEQAEIHKARLTPLLMDVSATLNQYYKAGKTLLFEGAQGALLDIDHGTFPFVTSSNCVAGYASPGAGVPPQALHYVLGIVKAYSTRVGSGPFPTELSDAIGERLCDRGREFGSVTGRRRRCGWIDLPALRRSIELNGVSGLCITKLDVLDGLDTINVCTAYKKGSEILTHLPFGADAVAECEPIYETLPGWHENTYGIRDWDALPAAAQNYLTYIQNQLSCRIDIVSTGPERSQTLVKRHPLA